MSESEIPVGNTGEVLRTFEQDISGNLRHTEAVALVDYETVAAIARVVANQAAGTYGLVTRPLKSRESQLRHEEPCDGEQIKYYASDIYEFVGLCPDGAADADTTHDVMRTEFEDAERHRKVSARFFFDVAWSDITDTVPDGALLDRAGDTILDRDGDTVLSGVR